MALQPCGYAANSCISSEPLSSGNIVLLPPGQLPPLVADPLGGPPIGIVGPDGGPLPPAYSGIYAGPAEQPNTTHGLMSGQFHHVHCHATPEESPKRVPSCLSSLPVSPVRDRRNKARDDGDVSNWGQPTMYGDCLLRKQLAEHERQNRRFLEAQERIEEEERQRRVIWEGEQAAWRQREIEQHHRSMATEFRAREVEREFRNKLREIKKIAPSDVAAPVFHEPSHVKELDKRVITIDNETGGNDGYFNLRLRKPCSKCHAPVVINTKQISYKSVGPNFNGDYNSLLREADYPAGNMLCDRCCAKKMRTNIYYQEKAKRDRYERKVEGVLENVLKKKGLDEIKPVSRPVFHENFPAKQAFGARSVVNTVWNANTSNPTTSPPRFAHSQVENMPVQVVDTPNGTQISFQLPSYVGGSLGPLHTPQICRNIATPQSTRSNLSLMGVSPLDAPSFNLVLGQQGQENPEVLHSHHHYHHYVATGAKRDFSKQHTSRKLTEKTQHISKRVKDNQGYFAAPTDKYFSTSSSSEDEYEQYPMRGRVGHSSKERAIRCEEQSVSPTDIIRGKNKRPDHHHHHHHQGRATRLGDDYSATLFDSPTQRLSASSNHKSERISKVLTARRHDSADDETDEDEALNKLVKKHLRIGKERKKSCEDFCNLGRPGFVTVPVNFGCNKNKNLAESTNAGSVDPALEAKLEEARNNAITSNNGNALVFPVILLNSDANYNLSIGSEAVSGENAHPQTPGGGPAVPGAFPGLSMFTPGMFTPLPQHCSFSAQTPRFLPTPGKDIKTPEFLPTPRAEDEFAGTKRIHSLTFDENKTGNGNSKPEYFVQRVVGGNLADVFRRGSSFWGANK